MADDFAMWNVPVIREPNEWACWFTCLWMVVEYYRKVGGAPALVNPNDCPEATLLMMRERGISWPQADRIVPKIGLRLAPAPETGQGLFESMKSGPVIFAGMWRGGVSGHWVVLKGQLGETVALIDPAGGEYNLSYRDLYTEIFAGVRRILRYVG